MQDVLLPSLRQSSLVPLGRALSSGFTKAFPSFAHEPARAWTATLVAAGVGLAVGAAQGAIPGAIGAFAGTGLGFFLGGAVVDPRASTPLAGLAALAGAVGGLVVGWRVGAGFHPLAGLAMGAAYGILLAEARCGSHR